MKFLDCGPGAELKNEKKKKTKSKSAESWKIDKKSKFESNSWGNHVLVNSLCLE